MILIEFKPKSLLYGLSCEWLLLTVLTPFRPWPDFQRTRTNHVLKRNKTLRWLVCPENHLTKPKVVRVFSRALMVSLYVGLSVAVGLISHIVHPDFLLYVGSTESEMLSHKLMYYCQIIYNLGQALLNTYLMCRCNFINWTTFDRFGVFALSERRQVLILLACWLTCALDLVATWTEMMMNLSLLGRQRYAWLGAAALSRNPLVLAVFTWYRVSSFLIFGAPAMQVMYSSACVAGHLEHVNKLLDVTIGPDQLDHVEPATARRLNSLSRVPEQQLYQRKGSALPSRRASVFEVPTAPVARRRSAFESAQLGGLVAIGSKPSEQRRVHSQRIAADELYTMTSIYQLERHLTQLHLFVCALDRALGFPVLVFIWTNFMVDLHALVFFRLMPWEDYDHYHAFLFGTGRWWPLIGLFVAGESLRRQCHRLINKLETIYLQHNQLEEHSYYKQASDVQLVFKRMFATLEATKFTCDNIIDIDLATLTKMVIYMATAMFVIVQFDAMVELDKVSSGLNRTSFNYDRTLFRPEIAR